MTPSPVSTRDRTAKSCTRAEFAGIARRDGWAEVVIDLIVKTSTPRLPPIGVVGYWVKIIDWPEIPAGKYC